MSIQTGLDGVVVSVAPTFPCSTCQHLQWPNLTSTILRLGEVKDKAKNGCSYCSILDTGISAYFSDVRDLVEMLDKRGMKLSWSKHRKGELIVSVRHWGNFIKEKDFDFGILHLSFYFPEQDIGIPVSRTIQQNPCDDYSNPESQKRLLQHLEECDRDHSCIEISPSPLPTRIIEVGQDSSQGNSVVGLRDSAAGEKEKYLILSHRWVATSAFDRFEEMKATGLSLDALPILFQDAVKLTRLLKVRYLWIDSICIDQKNEDDKAREVPQMAGYYENAYLTIAAACGSETQSGFLKSTGHHRIRIINCVTSDGHTFDIVVKEHSSKYNLEMSERGDPIHQRGWKWSLQEDILTSLQWKVYSIGVLPQSRRGPAPSWTWASIEGSVSTTPIQKWDQGVTVIQAPIAAPGDDHLIDDSTSLLTLQGPLIKARLDVVNARPLKWSQTAGRDLYWFTALPISTGGGASSIGSWAWDEGRGRNMPRIMFAPDTPFEPGPVLSDCLTDSPMRVTFRRANKSLNDEFTAMSGVIYCLRFSQIEKEGPDACMVVLSRINGPSGNVYERLGVAWMWRSVDTAAFFADVEPTTINLI